jgi:hypothetical protein
MAIAAIRVPSGRKGPVHKEKDKALFRKPLGDNVVGKQAQMLHMVLEAACSDAPPKILFVALVSEHSPPDKLELKNPSPYPQYCRQSRMRSSPLPG